MCCDITILHEKDINKFKRSIACMTIKVVIKCPSKDSSSWLDASSAKFCQIFNEEMTLTLLELFHVIRKEGTTRLIPCSQPYPDDKIKTQGENNRERQRPSQRESIMSPVNIQIQDHIMGNVHYNQVSFLSGVKSLFKISKAVILIQHKVYKKQKFCYHFEQWGKLF